MKKLVLFSLLIVAALTVSSCLDGQNDALYSETTIGNIVLGKFSDDYGTIYHFTEQTCSGSIDSLKRAIVACDVLSKISDTEVNARLTSFASVAVFTPKSMAIVPDEILGTDPIHLSQGWFSGDYLNIQYYISVVPTSATAHSIDLAYDEEKSTDDHLYFELRHNGSGEVFGNPEYYSTSTIVSGYASFPIRQLVSSSRKGVDVTVSWNWYKSNGDSYSTEIESLSATSVYSIE